MNFIRSVILLTLIVSFLLPLNAAFCQNEHPVPQSRSPVSLDYPQGHSAPLVGPDDVIERTEQPEVNVPSPEGFRTEQSPWGRTRERTMLTANYDPTAEFMHRQPLLVWRLFAELPLPPVKTFLFLLFADLLICLAFRHRTQIASMRTRSNFWKSLGVGVIVLILGTTCSRLCSETFILRPLASVLLGLLQFFCLAGVAVSSRALGSSLLSKLRILKADTITERPIRSLIASVLVGTLIISALAILPGLGSLPRLGARLLILFSMLGLGAIFSTRFGKKVD